MSTAPLKIADLLDRLGPRPSPDELLAAFNDWAKARGLTLYPHQAEALLATLAGDNTIITTPTGSGKSLIATAGELATLANRGRVYYTAPIKALVSEKFFAWCDEFGADLVGMVTGDASVNPDAPLICCTAEILANIALREGKTADVDMVIADEYHFIADPDRGWAWQVATTELPQAQFMLLSATLGDVRQLAGQLSRLTGRDTTIIDDAKRPVPLVYSWSTDPLEEKLAELTSSGQAPIYLVYPSQAAATDAASNLVRANLLDTTGRHAISQALAGFKFARGFGAKLNKLLRAGIGVHHAGLLPKYRRLVETLAQQGLLKVICGTDTLGVGINLPIRTVVFTSLAKFDGRRQRVLRSREFHQLAGRAGRPGFDPVGNVVAQAPEYQIENLRLTKKFANDEKKLKSVRKKKPVEGQVNYTEQTFEKLISSVPEPLYGRVRINHALLINLLQRDADTALALKHLVDESSTDPAVRRRLYRRAVQLGRSLLRAKVVVRRAIPSAGGRKFDLAAGLQDDFALNQPLSAFALAVLKELDDTAPDYALNVVSVIEATLEDPMTILLAQQNLARAQLNQELKAAGYDYTERQAACQETFWPQPMLDELTSWQLSYLHTHPWLADQPIQPKSVLRDMAERAMTFTEYIAFYKLQRAEGLLLRYLSDAWRALRQTVPVSYQTEELADLIAWCGQLIRSTDSSLVDEWEQLASANPAQPVSAQNSQPRTLSQNSRAFQVLIRNAMFRRVQLMAEDDLDGLAALDAWQDEPAFSIDDWDDALGDYWDEHDEILADADARSPQLFSIDKSQPDNWLIRQIIADPEENHDWQLLASCRPSECDAADELLIRIISFGRL